jgi:hypothetical protein
MCRMLVGLAGIVRPFKFEGITCLVRSSVINDVAT